MIVRYVLSRVMLSAGGFYLCHTESLLKVFIRKNSFPQPEKMISAGIISC